MLEPKKPAMFNVDKILSKLSIDENQKVAEFGCGNFGFFVFPLARLVGKNGQVFAIDILKDALREIKRQAESKNLTQIKPVWSDLEIFRATKIEPSSLDVITIINVLNQVKKKLTVLKEATRLVKSGGKILVVDWRIEDIPFGPKTEAKISEEDIVREAGNLGLKVVEQFDAGPHHYAIVLTKL